MSDLAKHLGQTPYAAFLGLEWKVGDEGVLVRMPMAQKLIGNPMLPALHGGATAALLELAAAAEVARLYPTRQPARPINVTVSYLRSGKAVETSATATVARAGRRILHVEARAWQDETESAIATLSAHFLVEE